MRRLGILALQLVPLLAGCDRVFGLETIELDAAIEPDAPICHGAFLSVCSADARPDRVFDADTVIDTTDDPLCATLVGSAEVCAILAATFEIKPGVTVRGAGPRPLVIVATSAVIDGTLDVSSQLTGTGAGAGVGNCAPATLPTAVDSGAGGAGGSLATSGGRGNAARSSSDPMVPPVGKPSDPGAVVTSIVTLRGGCAGTPGATVSELAGARTTRKHQTPRPR